MKKHLSNPCISITAEEEQVFVKETLDKCRNNMDIFEQFYVYNCELYDDISSKVSKLEETLNSFKGLWNKLIKFLQDKFFSSNKYDDFINDLYDEDILDDNELDIIQNNKILIKLMILRDKYDKITSN